MANVPFLTPTSYVSPQATPTPSSSSNAVEYLIDYLNSVKEIPKRVSPKLKKLLKEVESIYKLMKLFKVVESNSALKEFARVYTINGIEGYDKRSLLQHARQNITSVLRNNRRTKVKLILECIMERGDTPEEMEIKLADFHSTTEINLDGTDEKDLYDTMVERILEKIATFQNEGSPRRLRSIIRLELHTVRYKPIRGETYITLPKGLAVKTAIINMKNKDNRCFMWCVLRELNPKDDHPERVDKELKGKENTLNMEGIEYPVSLKDLNKFERQNPTISITVLGYEGKSVYPLRNSDCMDRDHNIILMLIEKYGINHYCLVKSISRLLASQAPINYEKRYFCMRCLDIFGAKIFE